MPIKEVASAALMAGGSVLQSIFGPRIQYKWNSRLAQEQNQMNRENQQWLLDQDIKLRDEQRQYDSPKAQMDRYLAAGLNPNLIYGSMPTSSPISAPGVPGVDLGKVDVPSSNLGADILRGSALAQEMKQRNAQTELTNWDSALREVQVQIAKTNPMLNPSVATAVAQELELTSQLKASESHFMRTHWVDRDGQSFRLYAQKMMDELEAGFQRLGLNTADLAIKNKVLESKEFDNFIKEVQSNWLKDGNLTPEHIRQGIMMILSKMLGK